MQRALSFSLSELHKHLPYSKGMPAVHMPLTMPIRTWGWGAVPWKHLDLMGLPHPSAYLWFCILLLLLSRKRNNMREAEITVFSLSGLLMPPARSQQAILSNCNCYTN